MKTITKNEMAEGNAPRFPEGNFTLHPVTLKYGNDSVTCGEWTLNWLNEEPNGQARWSLGKFGPVVYFTATLEGAEEILKAFAAKQKQANALRHILNVADFAQRNAPECETLGAGFVQDVCEAGLKPDAVTNAAGTVPTLVTEKHLPERFRSENFYGLPMAEFEARSAEFKAYCKANRIFYYARPREDFHKWEAWELAKKAGALFLILEDMS